jgi:hypothetical protein
MDGPKTTAGLTRCSRIGKRRVFSLTEVLQSAVGIKRVARGVVGFLASLWRGPLPGVLLGLCFGCWQTYGQTWSSVGSGVWNNAANWTPATIPTASGTATFGPDLVTSISVMGVATSVGGMQFLSGPQYTFTLGTTFTLGSSGITNASAFAPIFNVQSGALFLFRGVASGTR